MPYLAATEGDASISTFPTLYLPPASSASLSTMGARTLHGPHHVALKSTSTGTSALRTSDSKLLSLRSMMFLPAMRDSPSGARGFDDPYSKAGSARRHGVARSDRGGQD